MSKITKYFQITSQVMLSYEYDKSSTALSTRNCICYQTVDGQPCMIVSGKTSDMDGITYSKFDNPVTERSYVPGYNTAVDTVSSNETLAYLKGLEQNGIISRVFDNIFTQSYRVDRIRLHLLTGYVMNNTAGFGIKVMTDRSEYETDYMRGSSTVDAKPRFYIPKDKKAVLLNVVLLQERLKDMITWNPNPLYMNGKFYDRYIEIDVPSANYITNSSAYKPSISYTNPSTIQDILNLKKNSHITVEVETIDKGEIKPMSALEMFGKQTTLNTVVRAASGLVNDVKCRFRYTRDDVLPAYVQYSSNSDNFNVRLTIEDDGTLLFYPVYGESPETSVDVSIPVMNNIENGAITMNDDAYRDAKDDNLTPDDFYGIYGDDARMWFIVAELVLTYEFVNIRIEANQSLEDVSYKSTETKTYTIDYTNRTLADESFWRLRYKPVIAERFGMDCRNLHVTVNMRLVNRYNGSEIIRTATMRVPNASSYYGSNTKRIDVSNIYKFKVVNRISDGNAKTMPISTAKENAPVIIKSFYDSTNLVVKDAGSGNTYPQGRMTLRLYHDTHNYRLTLFELNDSNTRVPFNMTGPYKYTLVFPGRDGSKIKISPLMDAESSTLVNGELMFKISQTVAKNIMSVPANERYFAIMSENNSGTITEQSTLYEGTVDWINA